MTLHNIIYLIVDATYPRNIKATVAGRVATLTWDSPLIGLPPTAFYKVYYKSELQWGEYRVSSTATNFDLVLLPGTTYQIRMSTAVADDESLKSPAIAVKARDLGKSSGFIVTLLSHIIDVERHARFRGSYTSVHYISFL